ncbi:hypothetical protein [Alkaliphilus serpentinus]|uniref:Uncharacterized protein n=1 Tax=Alkaliphilus serpentinus TaxID=1482731 RepID=A0A833HML9_9FIRM|nr:hypothetical protein [Alkaliphilus serpentinus]KAB3527636.1 hypothetical protein F8153_11680 [Alkaliphilus serpentinus]
MLFPASQHTIIKTKDQLSYHFYLSGDGGICYNIFDENNLLIGNERVGRDLILDFSVSLNSRDHMLLTCITTNGLMDYYLYKDKKWIKKTISRLDIKSNRFGNLLLIASNKYTHILFNKSNLVNTRVTTIEHIYWNDESINKSTITSYLSLDLHSPFQVSIDDAHNLHLLYKAFHMENNQLFYKFYNADSNRWSSCELVSNLTEDNCHPHIHIDTMGHLHMVWSTIEGNDFTIKHRRKSEVSKRRNSWSEIKTISEKKNNCVSPIIIQIGDKMVTLCKQGSVISEIVSDDYGLSWSSPSKEKGYVIQNPLLMKYITNEDKVNYNISKLYGEIDQQVRIIGINLDKENKELDEDAIHSGDHIEERLGERITDIEVLATPMEIPQDSKAESNLKVEMDDNLYKLIEEVQHYIDKIADEVEKFEKSRQLSEAKSHESFDIIDSKATFDEFMDKISNLITRIQSLEDEQLHLHCELEDYQKKLFLIEEKLIGVKKNTLELEETLIDVYGDHYGIVNKFKNIFK